jgi:hypothetical protein
LDLQLSYNQILTFLKEQPTSSCTACSAGSAFLLLGGQATRTHQEASLSLTPLESLRDFDYYFSAAEDPWNFLLIAFLIVAYFWPAIAVYQQA